GACGKSAQFPLHVWLPDAMEGPTPVSALIHAATMVTAGVYMVARCTPLFVASPDAQRVVAVIGCTTAVIGAVIALTQTDLKRILAYSTISQLGYMFLGLGVGTLSGISSGMFHLFTHAFFKALLFLGAGSVMHAMGGVIDLRRIGGLRRLMPITHWTFLFGCLALAGCVPFAGFWSKDAIIAAAYERGQHETLFFALYWVATVIALLTAVYTFRAFFLTFYGEERVPHEAGHHAHESPPSMTVPLVVLAALSAVGGLALNPVHSGPLYTFLGPAVAPIDGLGYEPA
ncbi:MAG: proton-conducting transporter membrane subunit, partial [Pirellulales bacterium]